jgi:Ca-activated chloride channel homolog
VKDEFSQAVDPLKYRQKESTAENMSNELMTIKFRYKKPDGDVSKLIIHPVSGDQFIVGGSNNLQFVSAVAEFGMLLRNSSFKEQSSFDQAYSLALRSLGDDKEGYRREFLQLLQQAGKLTMVKTNKGEPPVSKSQVLY